MNFLEEERFWEKDKRQAEGVDDKRDVVLPRVKDGED